MNVKTQQILLHIAGWMVFLSLPLLFSPESLSIYAYLTNPPTQRDLLSYILILAVFYANFYWLIPLLYFRKQYVGFLLAGLLCFGITVFLPEMILPAAGPGHQDPSLLTTPPHPPPPPHHSLWMDLSQHIFLFLGMLFLALMLKIRARWKQAEKERLQAELSYLKAQINPHFLFNSLNSIYALSIEKSDQAPAAIVLLSQMMRYVLDESGKEWVPLDKEIEYIRSYITLQQIRFGPSIHIDFQVNDHGGAYNKATLAGPHRIAPLILIPFIENAFKHGVNAEENSDIHLHIELKDNSLHLLVINNKVTVRQAPGSQCGLGIDNTQKRLQLVYPQAHWLDIHNNTHDFQVSLTLNLL